VRGEATADEIVAVVAALRQRRQPAEAATADRYEQWRRGRLAVVRPRSSGGDGRGRAPAG
jgi:hypothetical protein